MRRTISHVRQVRIGRNVVCLWSGASPGHGRLFLCLCLLSEIVYPLSETCDGRWGGKRSPFALQDNYVGSRCRADDLVLPFLPAAIELSPQFSRDRLQVHEVTEPSTGTFSVKGDTNGSSGGQRTTRI